MVLVPSVRMGEKDEEDQRRKEENMMKERSGMVPNGL